METDSDSKRRKIAEDYASDTDPIKYQELVDQKSKFENELLELKNRKKETKAEILRLTIELAFTHGRQSILNSFAEIYLEELLNPLKEKVSKLQTKLIEKNAVLKCQKSKIKDLEFEIVICGKHIERSNQRH